MSTHFVKPRTCPSCGKLEPAEGQFIQGFCRECFLEKHKLADFTSKLVIMRCSVCGRLHYSEWEEADESRLEKWVLDRLRPQFPVLDTKCEVEIGERSARAKVNVLFDVHETKIEQNYNIYVKFHMTQCKDCSRVASGYFEVILQVRRKSEDTTDEQIAKAVARLGRELEANDSYIVKELPNKYGTDLRVSKMNIAFSACHALFDHVERSKKLIGYKNGKNVYKHTLCVRV